LNILRIKTLAINILLRKNFLQILRKKDFNIGRKYSSYAMYAAKINYHEKRHSIPQLFFAISCMIKAFV